MNLKCIYIRNRFRVINIVTQIYKKSNYERKTYLLYPISIFIIIKVSSFMSEINQNLSFWFNIFSFYSKSQFLRFSLWLTFVGTILHKEYCSDFFANFITDIDWTFELIWLRILLGWIEMQLNAQTEIACSTKIVRE